MITASSTCETVKRLGGGAGFDLVRISAATDMHDERRRYLEWIAAGRQAEMRWITPEWAERCSQNGTAKSVISVALNYGSSYRPRSASNQGRIARYAWGRDYHTVLGEKLQDFARRLETEFGGDYRWYVDTGPQMDKALAARSGLGWYGKNTNILTERFGSFVLLGEIITDLELEPDVPLEKDCGSCRLCMVACPTGALGPEHTIDSRKCISYLTIEHRGPIPRDLRPLIGDWVFGCDICQDVCPPTMERFLETDADRRAWLHDVRNIVAGQNAPGADGRGGARSSALPPLVGRSNNAANFHGDNVRPSVDLFWLLTLTHADYVEVFRHSSIRRAKVWMLRRNAAVALGNVGDETAINPLAEALTEDEHPLVRGHAAWALARLANRLDTDGCARGTLQSAVDTELDAYVQDEILLSLEDLRTAISGGSSRDA